MLSELTELLKVYYIQGCYTACLARFAILPGPFVGAECQLHSKSRVLVETAMWSEMGNHVLPSCFPKGKLATALKYSMFNESVNSVISNLYC